MTTLPNILMFLCVYDGEGVGVGPNTSDIGNDLQARFNH